MKTAPFEQFGQLLTKGRKDRALDKTELFHEMKVDIFRLSVERIGLLEKGLRQPRLRECAAFCAFLVIPIDSMAQATHYDPDDLRSNAVDMINARHQRLSSELSKTTTEQLRFISQ